MSTDPQRTLPRPKSTRAQIVQAAASVCLLALAVFGYLYTVRPVYTKQRAEEAAAESELRAKGAEAKLLDIEAQARGYRDEIERSKAERATYAGITRRYVIEQFTTKLIVSAAPLYREPLLSWSFLVDDKTGVVDRPSPYDLSASGLRMFEFMKKIQRQPISGLDLVEGSLAAEEFELLDPEPRHLLVSSIRQEAGRGDGFAKRLNVDPDLMGFGLFGWGLLSADRSKAASQTDEERQAMEAEGKAAQQRYDAELQRLHEAHTSFVRDVDRMKARLLAGQ